MRCDNVVQTLDIDITTKRHIEPGVSQLPAGIDNCGMLAVNDKKLVGLYRITGNKITKDNTYMVAVVKKLDRHAFFLKGSTQVSAIEAAWGQF
jgi:hypothetical protein